MNLDKTAKQKKSRPQNGRRGRAVIPRNIKVGPPDITRVTLRYVDQLALNPTPATVAYHTFRCMSLYDPDYTATGHQPLGFDEYAAMYNRYLVTRSSIKATASIQGVVSGTGMAAFGVLNATNVTPSSLTPSTVMESGLVKYRTISNKINTSTPVTMYQDFSLRESYGITNPLNAQTDFGSGIGSNPVHNRNFIILAWNTDASVDQLPLTVNVEITYDAIFMDRKLMLGS